MRLIKKINTSAALALDSNGNEIVVLGKGIGFPAMPYDLTDLSKIERTFYDVNPKYISLIAELPQPILLASTSIVELAEIELDCQLNANLPLTLADHLSFAHQRLKKGINLTIPIAYDIRHLYPKEYGIGIQALNILKQKAEIVLPETEAVSIAMHLINAEVEGDNIHSLMMTLQIQTEIEKIIEKQLKIHLDRESYQYSRFIMHLHYLVQRLYSGNQTEEVAVGMLYSLAKEYSNIYICTLKINDYLKDIWGWQCNDEELVFLMIHIYRIQQRLEQ